jgi:hypothetical protein
MGYRVALFSAKLNTLDEFLGSQDSAKIEQVWPAIEQRLEELEFSDDDLPHTWDEVTQLGRYYLHQIIYEGKVPDVAGKLDAPRKFQKRWSGCSTEYVLNTVITKILETDPLFMELGETYHWAYSNAQKYMQQDGFDPRAQQYWHYLCAGRTFGDYSVDTEFYYSYLYLEELEYLVNELYKEPYYSKIRGIDRIFGSPGVLVDFEVIVEAQRDLFAIAG